MDILAKFIFIKLSSTDDMPLLPMCIPLLEA